LTATNSFSVPVEKQLFVAMNVQKVNGSCINLHVLSDVPNVRQATSLRCIETIKVKYIVRIDVVISYVRDESSLRIMEKIFGH